MEIPGLQEWFWVVLAIVVLSFIRRTLFRKQKRTSPTPLDHQSVVLTTPLSDGVVRAALPKLLEPEGDTEPDTGRLGAQLRSEPRSSSFGGRTLLHYHHSDAKTIFTWFERAVRLNGSNRLFGCRPSGKKEYEWISYGQAGERIANISAGLARLGCRPGEHIAILGSVRPVTSLSEFACYRLNMVAVPVMYRVSAAALVHILDETQPGSVMANGERVANLLELCKCGSLGVRRIVSFDALPEETLLQAKEQQIVVTTIDELEALGRAQPCDPEQQTADDLASITYTSGKGGLPKGIMLSHGNMIAAASAAVAAKPLDSFSLQPPVLMVFGDLAHILPKAVTLYALALGASIGYYEGERTLRGLLADMQELRPTLLATVPSILYNITDTIEGQIMRHGALAKAVMRLAVRYHLRVIRDGYSLRGTWLDWLLFRWLRARTGGRIEAIAVGSAPLSAKTAQLVRAYLCCDVIEGYGKTETASACTVSLDVDAAHGHVGTPMLCNHVKLASVADMGYDAFYGNGEVCVKGPNICKGYWSKDGPDYDTVDADGWHHTGDIGRWKSNGTLEIIDRIGNFFRLANGVSVAPEKLESTFQELPYVRNFFLYGSSSRDVCVAVVVPAEDNLKQWLPSEVFGGRDALDAASLEELCQNVTVHRTVMRGVKEHGNRRGHNQAELPHAIYLSPTAFSDIPDLMTPTHKVRRSKVLEAFAPAIQEMYAKLKSRAVRTNL